MKKIQKDSKNQYKNYYKNYAGQTRKELTNQRQESKLWKQTRFKEIKIKD